MAMVRALMNLPAPCDVMTRARASRAKHELRENGTFREVGPSRRGPVRLMAWWVCLNLSGRVLISRTEYGSIIFGRCIG
jgi:hypothetical protein